MPIYEYVCNDCGHRFEVRQSFSDEPIAVCTNCGAPVRRVLYPAGVIFKGSGWYITDSRKGGDSGSSASSNGKSKAASSDTSEAKPSEPTKKESAAPAAKD